MSFFLFLMTFLVIILIISMKRNDSVYRYRLKLGAIVSEKAYNDIKLEKEWKWRFDYFDTVSYYKMIFLFWKKLDSFYPDKSFIHSFVNIPYEERKYIIKEKEQWRHQGSDMWEGDAGIMEINRGKNNGKI